MPPCGTEDFEVSYPATPPSPGPMDAVQLSNTDDCQQGFLLPPQLPGICLVTPAR